MCDAIGREVDICLEHSYAIVKSHDAALFSLVYAISKGPRGGYSGRGSSISRLESANEAAARARRALQRYPTELIEWPTDTSIRLDLPTNTDLLPSLNWSTLALPRDESAAALRWDSSPFERRLGGDGFHEEDPVHYLLSYWLGRRESLL